MTVRWKPLIVLSGLFLVIGVGGLLVVALDLVPANATQILPTAREEWKAGHYGNAQIHFLRALQAEPKSAKIYSELAQMYGEWMRSEKDPTKRSQLRAERLSALADAAKHGKDPAPRRALLSDALQNEDPVQSVLWARKLTDLDPQDPDAHFALASELEDQNDPALVGRHLPALEKREPDRLRTEWIRAVAARQQGDEAALAAILGRTRSLELPAGADGTDRMALIKLRQLDAGSTTDAGDLIARSERFRLEGEKVTADPAVPPARLVVLGRLVEQVQRHLQTVAVNAADPAQKAELDKVGDNLETLAESGFRKALTSSGTTNLVVALEYAEHLLFREDRERCLRVVDEALKGPTAQLPTWAESAARLREIAIKAALQSGDPDQRFARAEPYIKGLVDSGVPTHQALGHLFLGVIELERSGVAEAAGRSASQSQSKLRSSALQHLKLAAVGLPEVATAQALYGVALMMTGETGVGRQYLTAAQRLPGLEARYQLWAAWAVLQAGYPEEAEPIVRGLQAAAKVGTLPPDLQPSVLLLAGEILQAQDTPDKLRKARDAFQQAATQDPEGQAALQLRLAQLDIQLGETERGMQRINQMRAKNLGGAAAEHLAVLVLSEQGKAAEARQILDAARTRYPDSGDLASVDAALHVKAERPADADRVLAEYLTRFPNDLDVVQFRARLLNDDLKQPDAARKLLSSSADQADSSAPLVQLALLELSHNNEKAALAAISRIRSRWKEAAVADLLDAQVALTKKDSRAALRHLEAALQKDPSNKVALFWKAQLGGQTGSSSEAAQIYEKLVRERPVKELDDGLSLADAAGWALASLSLENQDVDQAITRLEGLLKGGMSSTLSRPVRWQLATARVTKGDWPAAKAEIEALLKDPKTTSDERIRAANLYRLNGEPARAAALLDVVLTQSPADSAAVAMRAFLQAQTQPAQAAATLRKAIATATQPASIHLMLAAIENMLPPADSGLKRSLAVIDTGLSKYPDSIELIQARYRVMRLTGDATQALSFVEARSHQDASGRTRRLLVDLLREEQQTEQAEKLVRELVESNPEDADLAVTLVGLVAQRAIEASERGDRKAEQAFNEQTSTLIRQFRGRFQDDLRFPQADAELAARTGRLDRAMTISQEIDKLDPSSPVGPMIRARLAAAKGWSEGTAKEYEEAVARAPRRRDLRLALGQAQLTDGKVDDAVQQANWLIETDSSDAAALVLKVRALTQGDGSSTQIQARRAEAVALLQEARKRDPKFLAASHLLAEIQAAQGDRTGAVATLKQALQTDPKDSAGLSQLIQLLATPARPGAAPAAELQDASALADRLAGPDTSGNNALAVSIGFHRAGQYELALPWAKKAADSLGTWVAHLNHADLILAIAEETADTQAARGLFETAVKEYGAVLRERANQVEAINNTAWILHAYLGRNPEALTLIQGLLERVDPATVPPDVYDTLGSIQESMSRPKDAEASYALGLKRSGDHPILNFHMARLLAADKGRAPVALAHLRKAQAARAQMPANLATELDTLAARLSP